MAFKDQLINTGYLGLTTPLKRIWYLLTSRDVYISMLSQKSIARLGQAFCSRAVNKENLKQTSTANKINNNIIARLNLTHIVGELSKIRFFSILELLPVVLYDSTIFQSSE